jgi:HAD superfamily hydrolase (TIGR01490 family)
MNEIVILDLDGVIVNGQSQQIFLNYLFEKRIVGLFFYLKIYFWFILYKLGFVKRPEKIMNFAFSFLKDEKIEDIEKTVEDFFSDRLQEFIFPEIIDIIKEHKAQGRELLIVSNAADILVKKIADFLEIKNYISTQLEKTNDKFTGKILGDIVYGKNKVNFVKEFIKKNSLNLEGSYAYTDHISDLDLLLMVSKPYAVNPDRLLFNEANKRNWPILIFNK